MSGPNHHKLTLPTHNTHALTAMRWVLDEISKGTSFKELDHLVSQQLKKNGRYTLSDERFPMIMSGYRVPLHRRD